MSEHEKLLGKLEIKLGNLTFSGEGDQNWLSAQLQKVIDAADTLNKVIPPSTGHNAAPSTAAALNGSSFTDSLATYLKAKGAEKNQTMRFLVTADWLRRRNEANLTSSSIAKALLDHQQSRLGNPSDCLNQNVAKGFCEKQNGGTFFITPEGLKALGHLE